MSIYDLYKHLLSLNETQMIAKMGKAYYKEFEN